MSMNRIPLPFLLYSYIAAELLAPFFASFLILYAVFFLVRLIPLLEVVLELGIGFADFIRLFSYIFPHMLLYVIPMASMTGVIIGFTRLANDREIHALKACGISLRQMLPPVIVIAAAISLLTGFFSIRLIPAGEQGMKLLMYRLAKEKVEKGLKERKFTEALGNLVLYVDEIDEQGNWHGVYVSDMRNKHRPIITVAESGRMKSDIGNMHVNITLNNGTLHNSDGVDNQVIRFERYRLRIPLKAPKQVDGENVTRLTRGEMTQKQLLERADQYGRDSKLGLAMLTEYHQRLVLPVGCFILSLLGLPLGLQAGPGKRAAGIPFGLFFFILYYVFYTTGTVLAEDRTLPLLPGMWLPNVLFSIITVYVFMRVDRERSLIPSPLQRFFQRLYDMLVLPLFKLAGKIHSKLPFSRRRRSSDRHRSTEKTSTLIHADPKDRLFHLSSCADYENPRNSLTFIDAELAQEAGFSPCEYCRTVLEKNDR